MMVVSNFFMSKRSSRGLGLGRHKNLLGRSRPSCEANQGKQGLKLVKG